MSPHARTKSRRFGGASARPPVTLLVALGLPWLEGCGHGLKPEPTEPSSIPRGEATPDEDEAEETPSAPASHAGADADGASPSPSRADLSGNASAKKEKHKADPTSEAEPEPTLETKGEQPAEPTLQNLRTSEELLAGALAPAQLSCSGALPHRDAICGIATRICELEQSAPSSAARRDCEAAEQACKKARETYDARCK